MPDESAISPIVVIVGPPGAGKTTIAAYAPSLRYIQAGDTGYTTLFKAGLVPKVPVVTVFDWPELVATIDALLRDPGDCKTLALDVLGGAVNMCREWVCETQFGGNWKDDGYASFGKGDDATRREWLKMLAKIELLSKKHGIQILILCHSKSELYKNPTGTDYDRFVCDIDKKIWSETHKAADAVLFVDFYIEVIKDSGRAKRGKAMDAVARIVYAEKRPAYDAKNRLGMPATIDLPDDNPAAAYSTIWQHMKGVAKHAS